MIVEYLKKLPFMKNTGFNLFYLYYGVLRLTVVVSRPVPYLYHPVCCSSDADRVSGHYLFNQGIGTGTTTAPTADL